MLGIRGPSATAVGSPLIWFRERFKKVSAVSAPSPAGMEPAEWMRNSVSKRQKGGEQMKLKRQAGRQATCCRSMIPEESLEAPTQNGCRDGAHKACQSTIVNEKTKTIHTCVESANVCGVADNRGCAQSSLRERSQPLFIRSSQTESRGGHFRGSRFETQDAALNPTQTRAVSRTAEVVAGEIEPRQSS